MTRFQYMNDLLPIASRITCGKKDPWLVVSLIDKIVQHEKIVSMRYITYRLWLAGIEVNGIRDLIMNNTMLCFLKATILTREDGVILIASLSRKDESKKQLSWDVCEASTPFTDEELRRAAYSSVQLQRLNDEYGICRSTFLAWLKGNTKLPIVHRAVEHYLRLYVL